MKSKKNRKDKDKSKHKGHNGPQGDDHHSGSQSMQHEAASQKEMLMKLKSLPEDEFNSKFEKMLVRESFYLPVRIHLCEIAVILESTFYSTEIVAQLGTSF